MSEEKSARYCGQYVPIQGIMFADYEAIGAVGWLKIAETKESKWKDGSVLI